MLCPLYSLHYHCEREKRVKNTEHYHCEREKRVKHTGQRHTVGQRSELAVILYGHQWKLLFSAAANNEALRVGFISSLAQYIIYSHSHTHTQYFTHTHTALYLDMSMTTISQSDLSEGAKFPEYIVHLFS